MGRVSARSLALDRVGTLMGKLSSAGVSLQEYAATVVPALRRAVGFDGWCMDLADPDSSLPVAVAYGDAPLSDRLPQFWRFEFAGAAWSVADHPRALTAAARRDAVGARRFAELLQPGGVADELRCWFAIDGAKWGSLGLFRSESGQPFTEADGDAVTSVLLPFATGARRAWVTAAPLTGAEEAAEPGTLLFGPNGALISQTLAARYWLAQLDASYSMTLAMLAVLETMPAASLRTRTVGGTWLRMSAGRLAPPAGEATVAITIQPATPAEITPLLLHAYGLTPRQRAVARLVMAGQSSQQIAASLHLSLHTVNDHVRAVADKTGVRSRGQLAAVLAGMSRQSA